MEIVVITTSDGMTDVTRFPLLAFYIHLYGLDSTKCVTRVILAGNWLQEIEKWDSCAMTDVSVNPSHMRH